MGILIDVGIVTFVSTSLSAGATAFLESYLRKKGENVATKEDLNDLVEQMKAVTTATKEIEAKISSDVWDRQKRWELKRDAIFEGAKRVSSAYDALSRLQAIHHTDLNSGRKDEPDRMAKRIELGAEWNEAANRLEEAALLIGISCGVKLQNLFLNFCRGMRQKAHEITSWQDAVSESKWPDLMELMAKLYEAMRRELGTGVEP